MERRPRADPLCGFRRRAACIRIVMVATMTPSTQVPVRCVVGRSRSRPGSPSPVAVGARAGADRGRSRRARRRSPGNQIEGNNSHLSESDRCESFLRLDTRHFLPEPHRLARRSLWRRSRSCTLDGNSRPGAATESVTAAWARRCISVSTAPRAAQSSWGSGAAYEPPTSRLRADYFLLRAATSRMRRLLVLNS